MLDTLFASRPARTPVPLLGVLLSALTHAAVVALLVSPFARSASTPADSIITTALRYLVPPDRTASSTQETIRFVALGDGDTGAGVRPNPSADRPFEFFVPARGGGSPSHDVAPAVPVQEPDTASHAFTIIEVDSVAERDPSSASPAYPRSLVEKGIEGQVTVRFVVDSTGFIDPATVRIIEATRTEFTRAVTDAMPGMRFRPAKMGTHAVRQLAEQQFSFKVQHAPAGQPVPAKKP